jgi:hypothetical protein
MSQKGDQQTSSNRITAEGGHTFMAEWDSAQT